jgi:uncharacterized protein YjbI with pentapeptide repeats
MTEEKYDQEFFLALAAKGKDAWNAWRRDPANKDVRVTFAGIDFSESPRDEIDFSRFEFGDHAIFSGCKWLSKVTSGGIELEKADGLAAVLAAAIPASFFLGRAHFRGANFGEETKFTGADFDEGANFTNASFRDWADFTGAVFRDVSFIDAFFGDDANFKGATFNEDICFMYVNFGKRASFRRCSLLLQSSVHRCDLP